MIGALIVAEVPALPLHEAGKYVAGAYVVLFAIVLIYVAIMAIRLSRIERELGDLLALSESSPEAPGGIPGDAPREAGSERERESALTYPVKGHPPFRGAGK